MTNKKSSVNKSSATNKRTGKIDIYPNRMTLAISVLGGTTLVLFALVSSL